MQLLFPYFNNSIPWCSYYKPLSGLESCNICDNIVVSNWERLWTLPRGLISGPHFLLVLNFLCKTKRKKKKEKSENNIFTERWPLSHITVFQAVKTKKKITFRQTNNKTTETASLWWLASNYFSVHFFSSHKTSLLLWTDITAD